MFYFDTANVIPSPPSPNLLIFKMNSHDVAKLPVFDIQETLQLTMVAIVVFHLFFNLLLYIVVILGMLIIQQILRSYASINLSRPYQPTNMYAYSLCSYL